VLLEKEAGYLTARRACQIVVENFMKEGGEYRQLAVEPGRISGGELPGLRLSDGSALSADRYLFPDVLGDLISPTRQEVFFFGTPPGDARFTTEQLPVWIDSRNWTFYGIPANHGRGFKIADDTRGEPIDPTTGNREATPAKIHSARNYLAYRFSAYEQTPDHHFIIDRHPAAANLWLVGGGSGHGFKHGPAVGELVADRVLGDKPVEPHFSLARFDKPSAR
jgi:glycine/D-amino acid oxidase-like deaminating enzyme